MKTNKRNENNKKRKTKNETIIDWQQTESCSGTTTLCLTPPGEGHNAEAAHVVAPPHDAEKSSDSTSWPQGNHIGVRLIKAQLCVEDSHCAIRFPLRFRTSTTIMPTPASSTVSQNAKWQLNQHGRVHLWRRTVPDADQRCKGIAWLMYFNVLDILIYSCCESVENHAEIIHSLRRVHLPHRWAGWNVIFSHCTP